MVFNFDEQQREAANRARQYWEARDTSIASAKKMIETAVANGDDPAIFEEHLRRITSAPVIFPRPDDMPQSPG